MPRYAAISIIIFRFHLPLAIFFTYSFRYQASRLIPMYYFLISHNIHAFIDTFLLLSQPITTKGIDTWRYFISRDTSRRQRQCRIRQSPGFFRYQTADTIVIEELLRCITCHQSATPPYFASTPAGASLQILASCRQIRHFRAFFDSSVRE
jgi:hypothetical protein